MIRYRSYRRFRIITLFIYIFVLNQYFCKKQKFHSKPNIITDDQQTYNQFISSIKSFPYIAPESKKTKLIINYSKLKLNSSKNEIIFHLGKPDCSKLLYEKEPPFKFIGTAWTYYIYLNDPNLVNEKLDRSINIYFDEFDKTKWITPSNIKGLSEIKKP